MEQRIYEEEQAHLSEVYGRLETADAQLERSIASLNREAAEDRQDMLSNLRVDNADEEVLMESYGEIETWNQYIDAYNVRSEVMTDRQRQIRILMNSPYFARVTLRFDEDEEPEDFYIGRASFTENSTDSVIIDWRAPVAETYYSQENGMTSYEVDGRRIPVELLLRRQFDTVRDHLNAYFDTSLAIEDPMLLQSLSRRHSNHLQDITITIQKEQNAVIRHPDVPVMLVSGIAGSGKTSVMMQRIAYLFYRKRKTLRPENVVLITLNGIFREYIDAVLPDLGERSPEMLTWMDFLRSVHVPIEDPGRNTEVESLRRIDALLPQLQLEEEDLLTIRQGDEKVLSRGEILEVLRRHDAATPTGVRLIQVTAEELAEEARAVLRRREKKRRGEDDGESSFRGRRPKEEGPETEEGPEEAGRRASGGNAASGFSSQEERTSGTGTSDRLSAESAPARGRGSAAERREENRMESRYGGAFQMIRECGWLNIEHIGQRLLGKKRITSVEWFYLRMALTGERDRHVQYVCVDEVQDYAGAQMMALSRYYANAHFLLLGDEFQAIREGTASFAELEEIFRAQRRRTVVLPLETSYRSTPEITALFASLLPEEKRLHAVSVQREGTMPEIQAFETEVDYEKRLTRLVKLINADAGTADAGAVVTGTTVKGTEEDALSEGLTAIVCADRRSLERVRGILRKAGRELPVVDGRSLLPKNGTFLIALQHAKGLEFDHVILPDADEEHYPDTTLSRHRLYTAISRATGRISILAQGTLTPLLKGFPSQTSAEASASAVAPEENSRRRILQ